jgi:hypothetical protein
LRIEPRLGTVPVRRIKPSHIDDLIADMNQDGVSPTNVIEAVGVLRRVLDRKVREVADLARVETDGLVFANRAGGYLRYGNWRRDCWNPAVKRSGVRARPHDLRRPVRACS